MNKKWKGIFFDLGGTLVFPDPERISVSLRNNLELLVSSQQVMKAIHYATVHLDRELEEKGSGEEKEWWQKYFGFMKIYLNVGKISPKKWERAMNTLLHEHEKNNLWNFWVKETKEVLKILSKDFFLGVISNSDGRVQQQLDEYGISTFFSFVLDSFVVKCSKPDIKIFQMALKKSNLPAEKVLYVGDFVHFDFRGATNAGLDCVIIDPLGLRKDFGIPTIPALKALPKFVFD